MRRFAQAGAESRFAAPAAPQWSLSGCSLPCASPLLVQQQSEEMACSGTLVASRRGLRNLHRYRHVRHKSLVKDRYQFSRNWMLQAGNNHELIDYKGHEREATEMFGKYWLDSDRDRYELSTSKLEDLPADQRLSALTYMMRNRWKVKDGNGGYDKAKMMLSALECFAEMRQLGGIGVFEQLPEPDQDTFLQYVESASQFAQKCVHRHPDAVAVLLRVALICDEMRCTDKRDEVLRTAERCTHQLGKSYAFEREGEEVKVQPSIPLISQNHWLQRQKAEDAVKARFPNRPELLSRAYSTPRNMIWWDRSRFRPMDQNEQRRVLEAPKPL